MAQPNIHRLRSLLFVPADVPRFIERAPLVGADAVVVDLEDAVRPDARAAVRTSVQATVASISGHGIPVYARVNRPVRELFADLEAVVCPELSGILLAKADSIGLVEFAAEIVSELEADRGITAGTIEFHLLIESATGLERVNELLVASPRVSAAALGVGDFSFDGGLSPDGFAVQTSAFRVINAARANGKTPLGLAGVVHDFSDLNWYRELVNFSKGMGSTGSYCIHPSQVHVLNEVFMPSAAEINWATVVVGAFADEARSGQGAFMHEGEFLDLAMLRRARAVLAHGRPEPSGTAVNEEQEQVNR